MGRVVQRFVGRHALDPEVLHERDEQGVGVSGLVMVSPVLDFGWRGNGRQSPLNWVVRLPSMAAAAREAK